MYASTMNWPWYSTESNYESSELVGRETSTWRKNTSRWWKNNKDNNNKKQFKRRQILIMVKVLTGLYSWGQEGSRVLGKIFVNHVIASSRWSPPSALVTLRSSLGTFVGNKAHRLCPDTRLFHALVPKGSMWIPVPERAGPITNHLKKYRSDKIKPCWFQNVF